MTSFSSTAEYIASEDLAMAVNSAIALEKPLLIKGEPGTGKTQLAFKIAHHFFYSKMNIVLVNDTTQINRISSEKILVAIPLLYVFLVPSNLF